MGGGGIAAFLVLIAATAGAFFAVDAGAFKNAPIAQIAVFAPEDIAVETLTASVDPSVTASTGDMSKPAEPVCNHDACARAFRSFRSSDCTFQPFDGPRRICTK
jgi:hypothetical protein